MFISSVSCKWLQFNNSKFQNSSFEKCIDTNHSNTNQPKKIIHFSWSLLLFLGYLQYPCDLNNEIGYLVWEIVYFVDYSVINLYFLPTPMPFDLNYWRGWRPLHFWPIALLLLRDLKKNQSELVKMYTWCFLYDWIENIKERSKENVWIGWPI